MAFMRLVAMLDVCASRRYANIRIWLQDGCKIFKPLLITSFLCPRSSELICSRAFRLGIGASRRLPKMQTHSHEGEILRWCFIVTYQHMPVCWVLSGQRDRVRNLKRKWTGLMQNNDYFQTGS